MTDSAVTRQDGAGRHGSLPRTGVIRGRDRELQAVLELVRGAAKGRGGVLLIEGELGAGKSLLLAQATSAAEAADISVAAAAADELSRFMPLAPVLMALGESPTALADEAGRPAGYGQASSPMWLIEAARTHLEKRAAVGSLLVSLDDLHWADSATLHALRTLPAQLGSYPLAWILARHAPDAGNDAGLLFDLLESDGAGRISLPPLAEAAVADLVSDALGATADPGLLALAAGAAGNPLLLAELVAGLVEEDAIVVTAGLARLRSAHVPRRVQAAVRATLARLSVATRQFLQTAATVGRSFRLEDTAEMLGTSPAALLPTVDEALCAGVLVTTRDALAFRHQLVWQAVSQTLPPPVAQALHGQIGEILMARGGSAASAATHLLSWAHSGDAAALAGLDRAAAEVLRSSPAIAADLAARALELTPPGDPELIHRSVAAAEALTAAGRLAAATELTWSALSLPLPPAASARLRCALSSALWMNGQATEALIEAERVLGEPQLPDDIRAEAKVAMAQGLTGLRDNRRASGLAESILTAPRGERSDVVIAALVVRAVIAWDRGRLAEALEESAEAVRLAVGQMPEARQSHPHLFLASRLVDLRRFDEARSVMRAAADHASLLGPPGWSATPATLRARMALAEGRLDDAVAEAEADLSVASALGSHLHGWGAQSILATVALRRGDLSAAQQHMQGPAARRSRLGAAYADTWDSIVTAQVEDARNGPQAAMRLLGDVYADLRTHRFLLMCDPTCAAWLVRLALSAGDPDRARVAALAAAGISHASPGLEAAAASAAHARGLVDQDPARLEQAATGHADPWARACAAEDLGELRAATGARCDAIARLEAATEGYEATGAARDVARVRRRLRKLGVRRRHWAVETRPVTGWLSLTGTERTVSELVSQGLTNQQVADQMFISVHTVAFHLRQVFRKLAISSRVELARIAVDGGGARAGG
jgi:DNA-binding CsgD family transcriptional regulator